MQKRPIRAITYDQFQSTRRSSPRAGGPHHNPFDRLFTALARGTGLTRRARLRLVRQIEESGVAERIQHLHQLLNRVVDGGWAGLWTSVRVCAGAV